MLKIIIYYQFGLMILITVDEIDWKILILNIHAISNHANKNNVNSYLNYLEALMKYQKLHHNQIELEDLWKHAIDKQKMANPNSKTQ